MGQREGARGSAKQSEGQREHTARLASQHQAQGQAVGIQMAMSEAHRRQGEVCVCARGGMAALACFAAPACDKEQRGTGVQVARAMQWPLARAHSGREGRAIVAMRSRCGGEMFTNFKFRVANGTSGTNLVGGSITWTALRHPSAATLTHPPRPA